MRKGRADVRRTELQMNHKVIHRELDRKTYFNALERMLISPSSNVKNPGMSQAAIFEDIMRKPPKNFQVPKRDEPKDPKAELFDLVWYDSLVNAENRVDAPSP
jgi:hypothetical protein